MASDGGSHEEESIHGRADGADPEGDGPGVGSSGGEAPPRGDEARLAARRPRYGYRRIQVLMDREGYPMSFDRMDNACYSDTRQVPADSHYVGVDCIACRRTVLGSLIVTSESDVMKRFLDVSSDSMMIRNTKRRSRRCPALRDAQRSETCCNSLFLRVARRHHIAQEKWKMWLWRLGDSSRPQPLVPRCGSPRPRVQRGEGVFRSKETPSVLCCYCQ